MSESGLLREIPYSPGWASIREGGRRWFSRRSWGTTSSTRLFLAVRLLLSHDDRRCRGREGRQGRAIAGRCCQVQKSLIAPKNCTRAAERERKSSENCHRSVLRARGDFDLQREPSCRPPGRKETAARIIACVVHAHRRNKGMCTARDSVRLHN